MSIVPERAVGRTISTYSVLSSRNPHQIRDFVSRVFCPHRFEVVRNDASFEAAVSHIRIGRLSLNTFSYGANVSVDPGYLPDFYLLQVVLAGAEILRYGAQEFRLGPGSLCVIGPDASVSKSSPAGTRKLLVKIDRQLLDQVCMQHLGRSMSEPIHFEVELPKESRRGINLGNLIAFLHAQMSADDNSFRSPLMIGNVENMISTSLLLSQPSNYYEELRAPALPISPRFIRRVIEIIEANADQPFTVHDLASFVGVSTRSLFAGFKKYQNTTPMALQRFIRMNRARKDLLSPNAANTNITQIASNWGFTHLGRFTAEYKKSFGELPSETLRRSKSR